MNWGYKILFGYLGFVALIVTLVTLCVRQEVFLVADDYYRQEVAYQQQIDKIENARRLPQRLAMNYDPDGQQVVFSFPQREGCQGEIYFFRPSDATQDFRIPVQTEATGRQVVRVQAKQPGLWRIKITWQVGDQQFYDEQTVVI
ncbi:hypothetical protein SAMN05421823_10131 [Catalinimonas alkaloidigena]|uniref:FixH protein n=1 Tax=Catalinimonas alkaloidigena TaxID=1075417 RepID=A0A1G8WC64_9BACT|nr:FixH family protein [Catalinimonas alkaloidigena]SDJ75814.1 hypothetical protein SAMN05421823_10131 [Catalinimonas alkaloidigena]